MKRSKELVDKLIDDLALTGSDVNLVSFTVDEHYKDLEKEVVGLIKDWEEKMGEDDKTLYSLGLRRVLDVIRGEERTLNS